MLFQTALVAGLLLAGQTTASTVNALFQSSEDIEVVLRRDAELLATLTRRQDSNPADSAPQVSTTPASGPITQADVAKWEVDTEAACNTALQALNGQASNPTGLAVCYNLPYLDNKTGIFQAELRMYNVSAPIAPWLGVPASDISMSLSYLGAMVQTGNASMQARGIASPADGMLVEKRQNNGGPEMLKVLSYVGQINSNLMGTAMTEETLRPLLIPQIEISARNDLKATLSSQEASFVNGVFANQAASTVTDPAAQASASAAAASAVPFVLPGTSLAFFPIGLVITCVWTAGFFTAVGFGTLGRMQFREQYRRRMRTEVSRGVRTI
ncbi:hypothetical protein BDV95DRAFT_495915 [Massariosphaeria phaeospora]|uniref:Uncharacterized protein n=1 Tax=Massariosphaeria phaeospora TaxID=100035 RepID=A0A7C8M8P0_9PLEO|nr:hypothetical protein BDV95DRAFT_495915 [Massariosphaeria phaeospora]